MTGRSAPLRKVVIVNTADEGGGAERMSMATLDGFTDLGIETWLLVGQKRTDHPRVVPMHLSPFFDYRPFAAPSQQIALERLRRDEQRLGLEDFNHPYSHRILELTGSPPDLVLCHNLHGGYFDLRALPALSRRVPVVLRIFDSWLLSGHCAISRGCPRWQSGCGRCPDLSLPPAIPRDATQFNWWRKRRILQDARVFVTAETHWMLDRVRRSLLAPLVAEWRLISGGVDLETFAPGCRQAARRELGLDPGAQVLMFVANLGPENPFKDFATVHGALKELARRDPGRRLEVLALGSEGPDERLAPGIRLRRVGYVRSPARVAAHFRAADVFLHAAIDETFGLAVAEALACGTPVITASVGGVLEIVEHGLTGLVVEPRHSVGMADAITRLLEDPPLRAAMGDAAATSARTRLDRRRMVAALRDWCAQIHSTWTARPVRTAACASGVE